MFPEAATVASGLRVPKAIGDFMILDAIRTSGGAAVSVSDDELLDAVKEIGAAEGLFVAPEGGACLPALRALFERKLVDRDERVVLFNTGAGIKYLEALAGF
jgi:threonine synthase